MKLQADIQVMWQRERGKPSAKGEPVPTDDEQRFIQEIYEAHQKRRFCPLRCPKMMALPNR